MKPSEQNELEVVYKTLLANLTIKSSSTLDERSNKLFSEANILLKNSNNVGLKIWFDTQLGFCYYSFYDYEKSSTLFFITAKLLAETPNELLIQPVDVLKKNAYFFQTIKEYDISIRFLERALKLVKANDQNYGTLLNALGTNYLEIGDVGKAEFFFNKTILNAKLNNDSLRYAKGLGDLAQIYIKNNNFEKAEDLLIQDIAISKQLDAKLNTMFAQIRLGKVYMLQNKNDLAKNVFDEALIYIDIHNNLPVYKLDIKSALLALTVKEKNSKEELLLRREIDYLRPIVDSTGGSEALKQIAWNSQKIKSKWQLEAEESKAEKANFMKWMFALATVITICFLFFLAAFFNRKLKFERISFENSLLLSELDKIKSEKALDKANNSLSSFKVFLNDKNAQIQALEKELSLFQNLENENSNKVRLEKVLNSHLMTHENWRAFKTAFQNEEFEFYNQIRTNYSDITESNLRIILLQKIGLTNQEIANLLGVTIHGIKKAKQRMRKKYGESIEPFL